MSIVDFVYLGIAVIGCAIGIVGFVNGVSKKEANNKSEFVKVNIKLDNLCDGVTTIKDDLKEINRNIDSLTNKQVEHEVRIQTLEKKVDDMCRK